MSQRAHVLSMPWRCRQVNAFSRDIAYSRSPAASRALALWNSDEATRTLSELCARNGIRPAQVDA
jgi:hypothetical protein